MSARKLRLIELIRKAERTVYIRQINERISQRRSAGCAVPNPIIARIHGVPIPQRQISLIYQACGSCVAFFFGRRLWLGRSGAVSRWVNVGVEILDSDFFFELFKGVF